MIMGFSTWPTKTTSPDGDFDINISSHLSTGSGLTLIYDDHSYDLATSGFHIYVSLKGKLLFICFGVAPGGGGEYSDLVPTGVCRWSRQI